VLQKAVARAPQQAVTVDVEKQEVRFADRVIRRRPDGPRNQLVGGTWIDAVLLERAPPSRRRREAADVRGFDRAMQ